MEHCSTTKRDEILSFAAEWMDTKGISEASQVCEDSVYSSYAEAKSNNLKVEEYPRDQEVDVLGMAGKDQCELFVCVKTSEQIPPARTINVCLLFLRESNLWPRVGNKAVWREAGDEEGKGFPPFR